MLAELQNVVPRLQEDLNHTNPRANELPRVLFSADNEAIFTIPPNNSHFPCTNSGVRGREENRAAASIRLQIGSSND
jgi:hypothetical protein